LVIPARFAPQSLSIFGYEYVLRLTRIIDARSSSDDQGSARDGRPDVSDIAVTGVDLEHGHRHAGDGASTRCMGRNPFSRRMTPKGPLAALRRTASQVCSKTA
jgi:hypothetical protein